MRTRSIERSLSMIVSRKSSRIRMIHLGKISNGSSSLRNTSTHFVVEEFEGIYAPLLQACVENYDDKARELLGIEISDLIPENYLVLSVRRSLVDFEECRARYGSEVVNKMISLRSGVLSSDDMENNRRYACSYVAGSGRQNTRTLIQPSGLIKAPRSQSPLSSSWSIPKISIPIGLPT